MPANRNTIRQPRNLDAERLQQPRNVHRRGFALGVRIGGEDNLLGLLLRHALDQLADTDVVRSDVPHRRQRAVQHMIQTLVLLRALERNYVARLCHHADHLLVARLV